MKTGQHQYYSAWAEIDLKAIGHNFRTLRALARKRFKPGRYPRIDVLPVVKAEAYGHGMLEVGRFLSRENMRFLGVSDVPEGIALREAGIRKQILLLESTRPELARLVVKYRLTPGICTLDFAKALDQCAKSAKQKIPVQVKIDTGMGRLGVPYAEAFDFIKSLKRFSQIKVEGIFTHFPSADSDPKFTLRQIRLIEELLARLSSEGIEIEYVHAANSIGLAGYQNRLFNLARPGLMLYGLYPTNQLKKKVDLRPAMSVKARVIFVKDIPAGHSVSYGRTFIAKRKMRVATLAIGYSDGYFRDLSNRASVLLGGKRCPVLGRVTMDQIVVDVSGCKSIKTGAVATVLGRQGKAAISAEDLASWAGTINYEIACAFGNQLRRVYK